MPNHGFGRCDGHHKMVDCIGVAPGDFPIRTRELEIDRKKMTGQIGRSTFVSPVARGYSASLMLSDGPYSSRFWLSIGIVCAKAVEAETIRKTVTIAIFSGVNIAISPWCG
jgi:hypothetical protein